MTYLYIFLWSWVYTLVGLGVAAMVDEVWDRDLFPAVAFGWPLLVVAAPFLMLYANLRDWRAARKRRERWMAELRDLSGEGETP